MVPLITCANPLVVNRLMQEINTAMQKKEERFLIKISLVVCIDFIENKIIAIIR